MSRRCGDDRPFIVLTEKKFVSWGVHHGQRHRVHGTPDGAAMVMGADIDVTRRRRSTADSMGEKAEWSSATASFLPWPAMS